MSITLPESGQAAPNAALVVEIEAIGQDVEPEAQVPVPVLVEPIPTIPLAALVRNPDNPRGPQEPDADLLASVHADGFKEPFLITKTDDPSVFMIFDGHRRMDVAEHLKLKEVPYAFDPALAEDPAARHLIAVMTSRHKKQLTALETASALFSAAEAGVSRTRLSRAYGEKAGSVDQVLKVGRMPETARRAAEASAYAWDITELAALEEVADDEEATARLIEAAEEGRFAFQVERERIERAERVRREEIRAELEGAGINVLEEAPENARRLTGLRDPEKEGASLTAEAHAGCPGHVAVFEPYGQARTGFWCTDPEGNGHQERYSHILRPAGTRTQDAAARRTVVLGNKDHKAAEAARQSWLRGLIAGGGTARKEAFERLARFAALTTLTAPDPVRKFASAGDRRERMADLLGMGGVKPEPWRAELWAQAVISANPRRLAMLQFAAVAAAYEKAMTKDVWRTDLPPSEYTGADRKHARVWLGFCAEAGHTLSPIEQAIVADQSHAPGEVPTAPLIGQDDEPGDQDEEPDRDAAPAESLTDQPRDAQQ
ncbi:ParB N-terminal domain-containing protein [Actinospica durhamensis]|uniref:ParB N-terminal domain-containing protein n=1 Tax=Actinospica durhamensis TaxID=1508375 RepID=A0A941IN62_9ACTN|nr:ParB N-terminal domain-containing protein [Actinospica durhamensis]MBR7833624.1 ParB N-terminal domain-containing protein [Actinospica durhamensis]